MRLSRSGHIGLDEPNVAQALAQPEPIQIADLREAHLRPLNEIILRAGFRALIGGAALRGEDVRRLVGGSPSCAWRLPTEYRST